MTLKNPFSVDQTAAEAPIDNDLMEIKIQENLEDLADQIDSISAGGGGAADTGTIAEIKLGGETNEAIYWKRRFSPLQHMRNADSENPSGFDPEGVSLRNEMLAFLQINDSGVILVPSSDSYLGQGADIAKGSSISFKIKKGINFFSVVSVLTSARSDNMEVYIDGATPSSLGLVDEDGNAASNGFSTNSATTFFQTSFFYYGLDGGEHIITITNNDSASKAGIVGAIEVGYRSLNPSIDESVRLNAGKANVRGAEVSFDEGEHTFGNIDLSGHTGALKINDSGTVSALDGECPYMSQVKAEEEITFSSAVTSLPMKNTFYAPGAGIYLLSTPHGNHHLFSATGKTETTIQAHSLDGLLWQSQPTEDFTPLDGFDGGAGEATGDLNINFHGTAPILIDSSNNKIDFKVTIGGSETTHAATIASGRYAADLVPIEAAIRSAMQTAKAIGGEYHIKYNENSQLWLIYVDDPEVEAFKLLFSSGVNVANSVHSTLGFSGADKTGALSYIGTTEKQHRCCRALEKDPVYMHAEDPRVKYSGTQGNNNATKQDIEERLNIGSVRRLSATANLMQIFPDQDCSGLSMDFAEFSGSAMLTFQIDDGQCLYLLKPDAQYENGTAIRNHILSAFISFPRGSRKITVRAESSIAFSESADQEIWFVGCRQYFTKPAYEKLTTSEAILKTFDISPLSLYATIYGHNAGVLYSPGASDDNINTISENGTWTATPATTFFNGAYRVASSSGDYVDIDFTLVGDGGGIAIKSAFNTADNPKVALFLSQSAIVEGTDRIQNNHHIWSSQYFDQDDLQTMGLPAGAYIARIKLEAAGFYENVGIVVYDTVAPQENANTITDINNTGQGVCYPINVRREVIQQDSNERVPIWLQRAGYKEGIASLVNYSLNSPVWVNQDDSANVLLDATMYYSARVLDNTSGNKFLVSGFFKAISDRTGATTTGSDLIQPFIDGVQTLNSYSQKVQVKGGSSTSATRLSTSNLTQKLFKLSCSFSAGDTFTIADTRGLKNDMEIILDDGANKEKAVIASFVVGTSFTVKKARLVVIDANVTDVEFQGFHSYEIQINDTSDAYFNCFEYEPLKISPSNSVKRRMQKFKYEKVSITFRTVDNGDDLYYPVHSDGIVGNWSTSTIQLIGNTSASAVMNFDQDLKNVVNAGNSDYKIDSERLIPILDEQERF